MNDPSTVLEAAAAPLVRHQPRQEQDQWRCRAHRVRRVRRARRVLCAEWWLEPWLAWRPRSRGLGLAPLQQGGVAELEWA
eukprot:3268118-Prymnesium_polylepis.1